jgi:hypothetical protein
MMAREKPIVGKIEMRVFAAADEKGIVMIEVEFAAAIRAF